MDRERVELEADIQKLHHTLEEDRNQWQYDYLVDSDDDDSEDDDDALYIDLDKQGSTAASVASLSARSAGGRTPTSAQSTISQPESAGETQSIGTEQDDEGELFREVGVMQEELDSSASLPATLESCLILNKAYQDIIAQHISRIELELAENKEAQRHIEEEAKETTIQQMTKKRFPYNATHPYFKMKFGSTPARNEDTRLKQLTDEPDLDRRPEKPWHGRQRRMLTEAVTEDALEKLLQPLLSKREVEEGKLEDVGKDTLQWQEIKNRIGKIDQEIEEKRNTSTDVLLRNVNAERVDWMKIANKTFEGKRDWTACHRAWSHCVDPRLNTHPITEAEEQRLVELVKETNGNNWVYIAEQLGTGRTPFQCLQYFQQNLNSEMVDRAWTAEENERLLQVVEKCQHYHFNWRKVSHYMEGRSGLQCYKQYSKLDPNINKGYWTEAEDAQLITAVQLLGTHNWGRVKELVPGRTREQCRERYANSLDPSISGQPWTYEEDKKLLQLVAQYGKGNWVKCCKELPGRTDNQILQRYRRLDDWRKKTDWFKKQTVKDRDLLQGNNLPGEQKAKAQEKNWEEFRDKFGVYPDDYRKQQVDMERGDTVVPRPPFMIGLANKSGCKVWERRIKLHKLIESHIDKLKEKYNFMQPSVSGVFELQDAISQLSKDCLSQRDQLMNKRKDQLGRLIHGLPSVISVKDLLAVSRGGQPQEKKVRGPLTKKRKRKTIAPRLLQSMKVDAELRKIVRANLKDRSQKKGRPRRFFWDVSGDQVLADDEILELKSTAFSLYSKSLGADHAQLLRAGRRQFPQLFHTLQQQRLQQDRDQEQPGPSDDNDNDSKPLRRSRRRHEKQKAGNENPADDNPFSLTGLPSGSTGFSGWQKQKDYELLEWLAQEQDIPVDDQLSEGVSAAEQAPPPAASVEVSSSRPSSSSTAASERSNRPAIGQGMSLVHAKIQEAIEEAIARESREVAEAEPDLRREAVVVVSDGEGGGRQGSHGAPPRPAPPPPPPRHLPNLPPTSNTVQSFKNLLLKRLGLIKKAGDFYNMPYYLTKKDQQVARLIQAGNKVQEMNRGTIDLSRMMNRVSQETNFTQPSQRKRRKAATAEESPTLAAPAPAPDPDPSATSHTDASGDSKTFDFKVLESIRKTEEFQLLQSRFLSVFTWPALLSAIYPPFQRKEFTDKAGGQSHIQKPGDNEFPSFQTVRKMPPMLKSKGFYRYANKSKEQKEQLIQKREEKRILKQVQELMADENDPNPHVTYEPDSDDDNDNSSTKPGPSNDPARSEDGESEPSSSPPKKKRQRYKRRDPNAQPVRQSSRVTERKTYTDSINRKRSEGPRKPCTERAQDPAVAAAPTTQKVRPSRLHHSVRMAMIDAIVENHNRPLRKHGTQLGQWNPGGYVSDDDDDNNDMRKELERRGGWVEELPSEMQNNLALLERESIVDKVALGESNSQTVASAAGGGTASSTGERSDVVAVTVSVLPTICGISVLPPVSSGTSFPESSGTVQSAIVGVVTIPDSSHSSRSVAASGQTVVDLTGQGATSSAEATSSSLQAASMEVDLTDGQMAVSDQTAVSTQPRGRSGFPQVVLLESDDEEEPSVASLLAARRGQQ
ncbi:uncharacterized protein LOC143275898 [Babylonia areolata]|uniref:uncharacterized protein LOC143275898 n=1 Tax=Babylonia areolata TaxID=304850 RepID=UPI003FD0F8A9